MTDLIDRNFSVSLTDGARATVTEYMQKHNCTRNKAVNELIYTEHEALDSAEKEMIKYIYEWVKAQSKDTKKKPVTTVRKQAVVEDEEEVIDPSDTIEDIEEDFDFEENFD